MIRAIFWKEWREQRTIVLAVMAFGVLALVLTAQFADPTSGGSVWSQAGARELMPLSLAYLAGAVCGAVLLADEKEVGTQEFLDTLPSPRRNLWVGKVVFGLVLVVAQGVALAVLAIAVGCADARMTPPLFATMVVLIGLLAFAWGLFGGALAKSTLGAVFQGSVASMFTAMVLAIPFTAVFGRAFVRPLGPVMLSYYATWLAVGLLGSAVFFTSIDRQRVLVRAAAAAGPGVRRRRRLRGPGARALVWLASRQAVYVAAGAVAAGAVVGAAMLAPDVVPVFIWSVATLMIGVLAGVTTLGEEQTRGVGRFWAERRLPLGRMWVTKVSVHLAIAAGAALVAFLPLFAAVPGLPFRSRVLAGTDPGLRAELGRLLTLSLVYGFVVGHLAGMVFKKSIVAGLAAAVTAATLVALILPGVIAGGAAAWQVWAPAVVLLVTARLLLYPWATERVAARGPVLRAVGGIVLTGGLLALGLAARVYEVPEYTDGLAESGFERNLPPKDANTGGRDARAVVAQYRKAADDAKDLYPRRATAARAGPTPPPAPFEDVDPLERVARLGWGAETEPLKEWLKRVFGQGQDWVRLLDELASTPMGVYDDPRDLDYFSQVESTRDLWEMAAGLRARGLQCQSAGDDDAYPRLLRGGLAVVRTARNKTGVMTSTAALRSEGILLAGLTEWLGRGAGRTDLLRLLLVELDRHEREMPLGTEEAYWAEQVIVRNTLDRVGSWVPRELSPTRRARETANPQLEAEADLVALAWTVPWERARRERILRAHTQGAVNFRWLSGLHLTPISRTGRTDRLAAADRRGLTQRRLALVQVALRLYEIDRGEPAGRLDQLVPDYLPRLPVDPYSDRPFGYRVSTGAILFPASVGIHARLNCPEFVAAAAASCLAHPVGGLNGAIAVELPSPPAPPSGMVMVAGVSASPRTAPVRPETRAPRGHGILWSVGPDGRDDGGHSPLTDGGTAAPGEDWIVVIPNRARR